MRRWLFCILGVLAIQSVFSQGNVNWPESDSDVITNANASIAIQTSSFPNITLEGYESIPSGSYIGVFYSSYHCSPNTICAASSLIPPCFSITASITSTGT